MPVNPHYFEINGIQVEWGRTLEQIRPLLDGFDPFKPYGGWPSIRCKCERIFGLPANECNIRAPFEDRPVLQVIYQIAPIEPAPNTTLHQAYLQQLLNVLGTPVKTENHSPINKQHSPGSVVFTAQWLFNDIRISLSVYGGTRNNESGPCAAGIFVDWTDEIKAAQPFIQEAKIFEKNLLQHLDQSPILKKFKLQNKQIPFSVFHLEQKSNPLQDNELRTAQMVLYKKGLYPTPPVIGSQLQEDEMACYKIPGTNPLFVSNKWDIVCLVPGQTNEITYWEILPERGAGGTELELNGLKIRDQANSLALDELAREIATGLGQEIKKKTGYDN